MRRIAQKGVRAPKANKAIKEAKAIMAKKYQTGGRKKAQGGGKFEDYSETNRYAGGPGFASKMMSGAYEAQPFVKAKRADEKRRAGMSQEQRDLEKTNLERTRQRLEQEQAQRSKFGGGSQRRGGKTVKRVKKAQEGTKKSNTGGGREYQDFSETNVYKSKPGLRNKMKSALYEGQAWVKGKKADDLRRSKLTEEQREIERINVGRTIDRARKEQEAKDKMGGQQRRGGVTRKAQAGARTKAQYGTKAKYGVAKRSSSKRSK